MIREGTVAASLGLGAGDGEFPATRAEGTVSVTAGCGALVFRAFWVPVSGVGGNVSLSTTVAPV